MELIDQPIIRRRGRTFAYQGTEIFWIAQGVSWKGRMVKRDGKIVTCGHKHKTEKAAQVCVKAMRLEKPGKCQQYRTAEIHRVKYKALGKAP